MFLKVLIDNFFANDNYKKINLKDAKYIGEICHAGKIITAEQDILF
ncbi:MAG: hypothetical protein QXG00_08570 [Candidatus Woesearchaeota archaeon]